MTNSLKNYETSGSATIELWLCHSLVHLVLYSAILRPGERGMHGKRFHEQSKVATLVVKYFLRIIRLHWKMIYKGKNCQAKWKHKISLAQLKKEP
jgi:hypothetical protein